MPTDPEVIHAAQASFAGAPMPARDAMTNNHCQECVETWRFFCDDTGTFLTWEAISAHQGHALPTSLLRPDAQRYYLPALITWCVRDARRVDVLVSELAHLVSRRSVPGFDEWARAFTPAQREAIALFLEWFRDRTLAEAEGGPPLAKSTLRHVLKAIAFWRGE